MGGLRCGFVRKLGAVKLGIEFSGLEQFVVASPLHDPALAKNQDLVGVLDRGKAVGDDERGSSRERCLKGELDEALRL